MRDPRLRPEYAEAIQGIRHAIAKVIERQFRGHQTQTTQDMATLIMAFDTGLAIQHLIDPGTVPGQLYSDAIQLILQPRVGSH
jgi:BetI-type transcriptional repressor, C-terminal